MTEKFLSKPAAQRHYIAFQVIEKKTMDECFENFRREIGPAAMERAEFEYWFDLFDKKNDFNFHYDSESTKSKIKSLSDLPEDAISLIVDKTSWTGLMALRDTSRAFRKLLERKKLNIEQILVDAKLAGTTVTINGDVKYFMAEETSFDCVAPHEIPLSDVFQSSGKPAQKAMLAVNKLGANTINNMVIDANAINFDDVFDFGPIAIPVKSVSISSDPYAASVFLSYMKVGTLEAIDLTLGFFDFDDSTMEETDQWKSAKSLNIKAYSFSFKQCAHFEKLCVETDCHDVAEIIKMKTTYIERSTFEEAEWKWEENLDLDVLETQLGEFDCKYAHDPENRVYWFGSGRRTLELKINATGLKFINVHYHSGLKK